MADEKQLQILKDYLARVPSVSVISSGNFDNGIWWAKLSIDIDHPLAWRVVQEVGHVVNYLSPDARLSAVFIPVSPPPYLNGGPREFLAWVIESKSADFLPGTCAEWLEGHLPRPVEDEKEWTLEED